MNIKKNAAFTLIELLVVVLIIGILAAVAVPQYRLAVERSRVAAVLPLGKAVVDAQERFYMATGRYSNNINGLDISFTCPNGFRCVLYGDQPVSGQERKLEINSKTYPYQIIFSYQFRAGKMHPIYCAANQENQDAVAICQTYSESCEPQSDGYVRCLIR